MHPRGITCSFIIVNWNAGQFLVDAMASIYEEWGADDAELIVVDNASDDGSVATARARFPQATLVCNEENLGFARGVNAGLAAAGGDLLFLVNPDAYLLPGSLERMIAFMNSNPEVGLMGPQVLNSDRTLQRSARHRPTLGRAIARALALDVLVPSLAFPDHGHTGDVDVLSGAFWVVRRAALAEVGGLDEGFFMYAEDVDWSRRFAQAGWRVTYFTDAQVVHHGAKSSQHAPTRFFVEMRRADLRYWRKHHGAVPTVAYALVLTIHHLLRVAAGLLSGLVPGRRSSALSRIRRSRAVISWIVRSAFGLRPQDLR